VVVATKNGYWDALSASSLAGALKAPVLLSDTDSVDKQTVEEIGRLGARKAYLIGCNLALTENVEQQLRDMISTFHEHNTSVIMDMVINHKSGKSGWVDFPSETMRGDVNNDGRVNLSDVSALINYLLTQNSSSLNLEGADANLDGLVNVANVSALISYLLSQAWPEPEPIDMWYLWGNFFGSEIWGYQPGGYDALGVNVLPMYPTGTFNANGKGVLTWTGFVPRQYFTIVHTPGLNVYDEMWAVNTSTGDYSVMSSDDLGDQYSTFLLPPGYYTITLNTATMTLSIEPYAGDVDAIQSFGAIAMPGYYNNWSTTDNVMDIVNYRLGSDNHDWFVDDFTITSNYDYNGEVKFSTYGNWDYDWGSTDFPYGTGVQGGLNIPVKVGTYKVFFNDITGQYNFIEKK
jgi:hypothetical protein